MNPDVHFLLIAHHITPRASGLIGGYGFSTAEVLGIPRRVGRKELRAAVLGES
jgi:hypothetical protein